MRKSILFFSVNYPTAKIYAIEPDVRVLDILEKNITTYELYNVELCKQAI